MNEQQNQQTQEVQRTKEQQAAPQKTQKFSLFCEGIPFLVIFIILGGVLSIYHGIYGVLGTIVLFWAYPNLMHSFMTGMTDAQKEYKKFEETLKE